MHKKGFATVAIVLAIGIFLIAAGGFWYYKDHSSSPTLAQPQASSTMAATTTSQQLPPLENLGASDVTAWNDLLDVPADCRPTDADFQFYQLANNELLVQVACQFFAYQGTQRYYLVNQTSPFASSPLNFKTYVYDDDGSLVATDTYELLGLPAFDSSTLQLEMLNKDIGEGICGIYTAYSFSSETPALVDARSMDDCLNDSTPENQWPKIK